MLDNIDPKLLWGINYSIFSCVKKFIGPRWSMVGHLLHILSYTLVWIPAREIESLHSLSWVHLLNLHKGLRMDWVHHVTILIQINNSFYSELIIISWFEPSKAYWTQCPRYLSVNTIRLMNTYVLLLLSRSYSVLLVSIKLNKCKYLLSNVTLASLDARAEHGLKYYQA